MVAATKSQIKIETHLAVTGPCQLRDGAAQLARPHIFFLHRLLPPWSIRLDLLESSHTHALDPHDAPDIVGGQQNEDQADEQDGGASPLKLSMLTVVEVAHSQFDKKRDR